MLQRSRFGCRTCKIRRVKCDETLPFCKKCAVSGRYCDGPSKNKTMFVTPMPGKQRYTSWSTAATASSPTVNRALTDHLPPPCALAPVPNLQPAASRALSYFRERVGPALGGELDQDFWYASVLQLCQSSSMIRNAVLAVSSFFEKPVSNALSGPHLDPSFSDPQQRRALKWYSASLSDTSSVLSQPQDEAQFQLALTTCILFTCIEFQQMNVVSSMKLMMCGYNLLIQGAKENMLGHNPFIQGVLVPIFVRQTVVLMIYGYTLPDGWFSPKLRFSLAFPSSKVESLQEARTKLMYLMLDAFVIVRAAYLPQSVEVTAQLKTSQSSLLENLEDWDEQLQFYIKDHYAADMPLIQNNAVRLLQIYALVMTIWLSSCTESSETVYDVFTLQFTTILDHIEALVREGSTVDSSFSFELRILPPLYFTCWRCRIPSIRRRALRILKQAPAQEGLFHRDVAVWAVTQIMEVEEGIPHGNDVLQYPGIIPAEEARLRHVAIQWNLSGKSKTNSDDQTFPKLVHSRFTLVEDEHGIIKEMYTFEKSP